MHTLAAIRTELLRLKWHVAAIRFEIAMRRHALALKAFNPNQPRVPAGSSQGGQWTSGSTGSGAVFIGFALADDEGVESAIGEAGAFDDFDSYDGIGEFDGPDVFDESDPTDFSDARRRLPILPIESLSDVPSVRPDTIQEINRIAREVSRNPYLAPYYFVTIAQSAGHWLNEKYWEIRADQDPPKSLEELQDAVLGADRRGYDRHHIVEQSAARNQRFPDSWIDGPDNLVLIPRYKHEKINSWYQIPNVDYDDLTPRRYLQGKSWEEHRRVGIDAMQKVGILKP